MTAVRQPWQGLALSSELLVLSAGHALFIFSLDGTLLHSVPSAHSALIRELALYSSAVSGRTYLASTCEAKKLVLWEWLEGKLEKRSECEIPKRANRLIWTEEGKEGKEEGVVVADKFGDAYFLDLLSPSFTSPSLMSKPFPLLGHVSMLTSLTFIPRNVLGASARVVTADRDEHVRLSRFPDAWVIDRYLWGANKPVAATLYLPTSEGPMLLHGGGNSTLQLNDLRTGALRARHEVRDLLEPTRGVEGIGTWQERKDAEREERERIQLATGRGKAAKKGKGKAKEEEMDVDEAPAEDAVVKPAVPTTVTEEEAPVDEADVEREAAAEAEAQEAEEEEQKEATWSVSELLYLPPSSEGGEGGVVVSALGCTALLYLPLSLLLAPPPAATNSSEEECPAAPRGTLIDLLHPILGVRVAGGLVCATLDVTRSSSSSLAEDIDLDTEEAVAPAATGSSVRLLQLSSSGSLVPVTNATSIESLIASSSPLTSESEPYPRLAALFPALFYAELEDLSGAAGPDIADAADAAEEKDRKANALKVKGRQAKRKFGREPEEPEEETTTSIRHGKGKRARGRQVTEDRFARAQEKLGLLPGAAAAAAGVPAAEAVVEGAEAPAPAES